MEPANSIIQRFGGNTKLANALGVSASWVYRWKLPKPHGNAGRIPHKLVPKVLAAARDAGISLTVEEIWGQP